MAARLRHRASNQLCANTCRSMLLRCALLIFFAITPHLALASTFTLSASAGQFTVQSLGSPSSQGALSAVFRIAKFDSSKDWPAAAYVGFFQGENRNESVQFLIIRNHASDTYVVAGYRVIEAGREVKVASLATLSPSEQASVAITIDNGLVTIALPNHDPVVFQTKLGNVTPYASVSSGTAEFEIAP